MEYEIKGTPLPVVICHLKKGESLVCDSGAMAWMDPTLNMETTTNGGMGKAFGRMFSGETFFMNRYTAMADGKIAFSSSFPGEIRAYDIAPGKELIVQKSSFLACEETVDRAIHFRKRASAGFFGGEGFIMNKFSGQGKLFVEIDGSAVEYELAAGQKIIVDTGYVALMDATCTLEIQSVAGLKNKLFGGEGFFNTVVTGPGRVLLQTMPISTLANSILALVPNK